MATAATIRQAEALFWHDSPLSPVTLSASSSENPPSSSGDDTADNLAAFPAMLDSALCWDSMSITSHEYLVHLSEEDVNAIDTAVAKFKDCCLAIPMICPENFPLPQALAQVLRSASSAVHDGRGFVVLRGLKPNTREEADNVIAFCGVLSYVGIERATNGNCMSMDHLRDASHDLKPKGREHVELNPGKMMAPLKYHADRDFADVVALFVKSKAAFGGQQRLSSFWTAYNRMMGSCPEALRVLAQDFPWPGVVDDEPATTYTPVIFHHSGKVYCQLVYRIFEGRDILSAEQWAALDALEKCADENSIEVDVEEGDIQLINNLALLHGRRAWTDNQEKQRHYFRVGLRDPEKAWPRPVNYEWLFDKRFSTPVEEQTVPVTDFDPYGLTTLSATDHG